MRWISWCQPIHSWCRGSWRLQSEYLLQFWFYILGPILGFSSGARLSIQRSSLWIWSSDILFQDQKAYVWRNSDFGSWRWFSSPRHLDLAHPSSLISVFHRFDFLHNILHHILAAAAFWAGFDWVVLVIGRSQPSPGHRYDLAAQSWSKTAPCVESVKLWKYSCRIPRQTCCFFVAFVHYILSLGLEGWSPPDSRSWCHPD